MISQADLGGAKVVMPSPLALLKLVIKKISDMRGCKFCKLCAPLDKFLDTLVDLHYSEIETAAFCECFKRVSAAIEID